MKCFNLLSQSVKGVQEVDVQEGLPNLGGQRHLEIDLGKPGRSLRGRGRGGLVAEENSERQVQHQEQIQVHLKKCFFTVLVSLLSVDCVCQI
jgi:hypothetical protein